ncbi:U32 family peptidase [Treponema parvum]|uniref:U32 family peptidase n=1 Tax=Treponema parvum TaxID=138851 RepID=A0A975F0D8_9SPIR|nr:peptidase U32 family protein [Treponema parvum]QTQ12281.1 U32 family peptidase [Treponema parvum]
MVELLAPAGNVEALDAAIGEGADAVYLGLKSFNARLRSSNFAWNQFEAAVYSLHRLGKKIYVAVNTVVEDRETERLYRFLEYLNRVGPDGLIVQDFAVLRMARQFFPGMVLHASTQMNVESAAAVNLLSKEGVKRVVVARELGLEEIRAIKARTNAELEMFVHGALCVSESGLCLFSSFLGGKSANRGMCTQACRRFYTADVPGGYKQGYYFSPYDLQLIDRIPELIEAGVDSFKIEGRMKSAEYVGSVVSAYRYVIDHYKDNKKETVAAAKRMLATDFARSKTSYWYGFKSIEEGMENAGKAILNPDQAGGTGIFLGTIESFKVIKNTIRLNAPYSGDEGERESGEDIDFFADDKKGDIYAALLSGGTYDPEIGDSIRLHKKDDSGRKSHKVRAVTVDKNGRRWIDIPPDFSKGDSVYLLQTKAMSKHYPRVLPNDISSFRRQPGAGRLPILDLTPIKKDELSYFPEGLYVQVSTLEDLFVVQSARPVRVILELNGETASALKEKKIIPPFSKKQIFLSLDPFVPEGTYDALKETVDSLVNDGFHAWVVNNIAHISMLRGKNVNIVAGPYLYTFNRWAVSWLENQNIGAFISPYENSRKNLEATYDRQFRQRVLVPVFAYPALFRMRFKLPGDYDFTYFTDKEEKEFKVNSTNDGSFVMPEEPFSILDKTEIIRAAGFKSLLIDLSKTKVSKSDFKQIVNAYLKHLVLPGTSRFNWKDGFYSQEKIDERKAVAAAYAAGTFRPEYGAAKKKKTRFGKR